MKFGFAVVGVLTTCLSLPALSATLKLSPEINVLVIDGKKVSSSLFKGSKGLELADGQHQILFKVEKPVRIGSRDEEMYTSSALIANFDSADSDIISIELPKITTKAEANRFDKSISYRFINEKGQTINSVQDKLNIQGLVIAADYELEMAKYNASGNIASMPELANITVYNPTAMGMGYPQTSMPVTQTKTPVSSNAVTLKGETAEEEMLQYWFQRADSETQKRFLNWANKRAAK